WLVRRSAIRRARWFSGPIDGHLLSARCLVPGRWSQQPAACLVQATRPWRPSTPATHRPHQHHRRASRVRLRLVHRSQLESWEHATGGVNRHLGVGSLLVSTPGPSNSYRVLVVGPAIRCIVETQEQPNYTLQRTAAACLPRTSSAPSPTAAERGR